MDTDKEKLELFVGTMMPILDERQRRLFLGALSRYLGRGSGSLLHEMTRYSRSTIFAGQKECEEITPDPRYKGVANDRRRVRSPRGSRSGKESAPAEEAEGTKEEAPEKD